MRSLVKGKKRSSSTATDDVPAGVVAPVNVVCLQSPRWQGTTASSNSSNGGSSSGSGIGGNAVNALINDMPQYPVFSNVSHIVYDLQFRSVEVSDESLQQIAALAQQSQQQPGSTEAQSGPLTVKLSPKIIAKWTRGKIKKGATKSAAELRKDFPATATASASGIPSSSVGASPPNNITPSKIVYRWQQLAGGENIIDSAQSGAAVQPGSEIFPIKCTLEISKESTTAAVRNIIKAGARRASMPESSIGASMQDNVLSQIALSVSPYRPKPICIKIKEATEVSNATDAQQAARNFKSLLSGPRNAPNPAQQQLQQQAQQSTATAVAAPPQLTVGKTIGTIEFDLNELLRHLPQQHLQMPASGSNVVFPLEALYPVRLHVPLVPLVSTSSNSDGTTATASADTDSSDASSSTGSDKSGLARKKSVGFGLGKSKHTSKPQSAAQEEQFMDLNAHLRLRVTVRINGVEGGSQNFSSDVISEEATDDTTDEIDHEAEEAAATAGTATTAAEDEHTALNRSNSGYGLKPPGMIQLSNDHSFGINDSDEITFDEMARKSETQRQQQTHVQPPKEASSSLQLQQLEPPGTIKSRPRSKHAPSSQPQQQATAGAAQQQDASQQSSQQQDSAAILALGDIFASLQNSLGRLQTSEQGQPAAAAAAADPAVSSSVQSLQKLFLRLKVPFKSIKTTAELLEQAEKQLSDYENRVKIMEESLEAVVQERDAAVKDLESTRKNLEKIKQVDGISQAQLEHELEETGQEAQRLEHERSSLRHQIEHLEKQTTQFSISLKSYESEILHLKESIWEKNQLIVKLNERIDRQAEHLLSSQAEVQRLQTTLKILREELERSYELSLRDKKNIENLEIERNALRRNTSSNPHVLGALYGTLASLVSVAALPFFWMLIANSGSTADTHSSTYQQLVESVVRSSIGCFGVFSVFTYFSAEITSLLRPFLHLGSNVLKLMDADSSKTKQYVISPEFTGRVRSASRWGLMLGAVCALAELVFSFLFYILLDARTADNAAATTTTAAATFQHPPFWQRLMYSMQESLVQELLGRFFLFPFVLFVLLQVRLYARNRLLRLEASSKQRSSAPLLFHSAMLNRFCTWVDMKLNSPASGQGKTAAATTESRSPQTPQDGVRNGMQNLRQNVSHALRTDLQSPVLKLAVVASAVIYALFHLYTSFYLNALYYDLPSQGFLGRCALSLFEFVKVFLLSSFFNYAFIKLGDVEYVMLCHFVMTLFQRLL